jgi:hypothetical protein
MYELEWDGEVESNLDLSSLVEPKNSIKLGKVWSRINKCGESREEFVDYNNDIVELPVYCDNRACQNEHCKDHRLYKNMREHLGKINGLNKNIKSAKAWIFTDCKVPIDKLSRNYLQKRILLLYKILDIKNHRKYGSVTSYSIHMELKMYKMKHEDCKTCNNCLEGKKQGCKIGDNCFQFNMVFVHFHVVSGGVKNLRLVRLLWGKVIRVEYAINRKRLGFYVSKYASKTPNFPSSVHADFYILFVYKLMMHRFNVVALPYVRESLYYHVGSLVNEIKRTLKRYGNYDNYFGIDRKNRYSYMDADESMSAVSIAPKKQIKIGYVNEEDILENDYDEWHC